MFSEGSGFCKFHFRPRSSIIFFILSLNAGNEENKERIILLTPQSAENVFNKSGLGFESLAPRSWISQPPAVRNKCLLFQPLSLRLFVAPALADCDRLFGPTHLRSHGELEQKAGPEVTVFHQHQGVSSSRCRKAVNWPVTLEWGGGKRQGANPKHVSSR